jgi:D-amino peptidase
MLKKFNTFISFDIEGISCVSSWNELRKDAASNLVRKLATDEVNAAIRGIKKSGKNIGDIVICDSHAEGENLLINQLERGTYLVRGTPRNYGMVEGINESFDVLFFIGYHSMAGTKGGGMDHTYSSSTIYNIKVNGKYVGETEINAAVAGYYKVPLVFVSGDNSLVKEVKIFFGNKVETVITKYGISRFSAKCRHPLDVQKEIEKKAARAVKNYKHLKPFMLKTPIHAEIDILNSLIGDMLEPLPGIKRIESRKFRFKAKNALEFYRMIRLICNLGRTS